METKRYIDGLMPEFLGVRHNSFMKNILRTGKSKIIKNKNSIYLTSQDGFITPC